MSYSYYFDKNKNRFILRQTIDGKRRYVSSHKTEKGAQMWKKALESTVSSYEPEMIESEEPRILKFLKKKAAKWRNRKQSA